MRFSTYIIHYKKKVNYLQIITQGFWSIGKLIGTYRFYIRIWEIGYLQTFLYVTQQLFPTNFLHVKFSCNFDALE